MNNTKTINGCEVVSFGGFITVKHWNVYKDGDFKGCSFKFKDAKQSCLSENFENLYKGRLYD